MQRTHETRESLESSRDSDARVDLDQGASGSVDVDLQQTRVVLGRVEQREQALGVSNERIVGAACSTMEL